MPVIVKPLEASLTRDTDTFSKMDPFVEVSIGNEMHKTKVHQSGGKTPKWNDVLSFNSRAEVMKVTIKDEDITSDDLVGIGEFNINGAYTHPNQPATFPIDILFEGKNIGKLLVCVEFRP